MTKKILVTGGAGFIGSYIVDFLIKDGNEVVVLDNLEPQVHRGNEPDYLNPEAKYIFADIRDEEALKNALDGVEGIFHEASKVGVGQSMYQIKDYVDSNTLGTAVLLDILANEEHDVKKMVIASSMSNYGEGKYECDNCGIVYPKMRTKEQLMGREWEMKCPTCDGIAKPLPTDEEKPMHSTSIYAITKKDQEEMCLSVGRAYGIPTVPLRYFNVYGPRQALSNPYTGVCAIFSCRIRNNNPPSIYEDGLQSRDFISIYDIAKANLLVMEKNRANYEIFNVGTGKPTPIREVAETMIRVHGADLKPVIENKYREGDIRHCYADISKLKKLGFEPSAEFEGGMKELSEWVNAQPSCEVDDQFEKARKELEDKKLTL
jgi:dTDP-L-rhamnose 4-epimerase